MRGSGSLEVFIFEERRRGDKEASAQVLPRIQEGFKELNINALC
jgi:hypothetical protein